MNIARKGTEHMICEVCDDVYLKVGSSDAIRLARPPRTLPGNVKQGKCPKHKQGE